MFERFNDEARRVVVLAQEEARLLNHNYIGTEHVLLGVIGESGSLGAMALTDLGLSLDSMRSDVRRRIGEGMAPPSGHIPFTPPAKKVLELSLREALQLGHNYIGTEHILLALIAEGEGVACEILTGLGVTLSSARSKIIGLLQQGHGNRPVIEFPEGVPVAFAISKEEAVRGARYEPASGPLCSMCKCPLLETATYRVIEVAENKGESHRRFLVLYCGGCGDTIKIETLPEEE